MKFSYFIVIFGEPTPIVEFIFFKKLFIIIFIIFFLNYQLKMDNDKFNALLNL